MKKEEEEETRRREAREKEAVFEVDCKICLTEIELKDINPLDCNHYFHNECIGQYFKTQINDKAFPITCPQVDCDYEVTP
jgi:hypothetical protein